METIPSISRGVLTAPYQLGVLVWQRGEITLALTGGPGFIDGGLRRAGWIGLAGLLGSRWCFDRVDVFHGSRVRTQPVESVLQVSWRCDTHVPPTSAWRGGAGGFAHAQALAPARAGSGVIAALLERITTCLSSSISTMAASPSLIRPERNSSARLSSSRRMTARRSGLAP